MVISVQCAVDIRFDCTKIGSLETISNCNVIIFDITFSIVVLWFLECLEQVCRKCFTAYLLLLELR